jgi:glutamate dehydrogenase
MGSRGRREVAERIDQVAQLVKQKMPEERAGIVVPFVRWYWEDVPGEDLEQRGVAELYGAAVAHWNLAQQRRPGRAEVRVYTPALEQHGWQSSHSVVEICNDDMPFLVDSVTTALTRRSLGIHLVVHPIITVRRDEEGQLTDLVDDAERADDPDDGAATLDESFIHVEFDRQTDPELLGEIEDAVREVLDDARAAVEDWDAMRQEVHRILEILEEQPLPADEREVEEARSFLEWIEDDHFTFLGYRAYDLLRDEGGLDELRSVPDTGLGILRQPEGASTSTSFENVPPEVRKLAREPNVLNLTKANSRSTVHRPAYLDYIGVKRFGDGGEVIGEWRFLGLYTSAAYHTSPTRIPLLRRKVEQVLDRSGAPSGSHAQKDILAILENYPRDELFQTPVDQLYDIVMGIHHLQERRQVRLFGRRDIYGRFYSFFVYLPRDRYDTSNRRRIQEILIEEFDGTELDYSTSVSESVLARLHFIIHTASREPVDYDHEELEDRIAEATRSWSEHLEDVLVDQLGEEAGIDRWRRYGEAFPPGYRGDTAPRLAVTDIERLEQLEEDGDLEIGLYQPLESPRGFLRLKLYHLGDPITLSDVMPILEDLGLRVTDQRPYEVRPEGARRRWIYDFGLDVRDLGGLDLDHTTDRFRDAFENIWRGRAEDDRFNQLVIGADITWREVSILRAYARYVRQVGTQFSQEYMAATLAANPDITRRIVELFRERFDPDLEGDRQLERLREEIEHDLDEVASLDEDRILRLFRDLVESTLRTNAYQREEDGSPRRHLSFKVDPHAVPEMPPPRPTFEIWVYSPRTEGVHLRFGNVARGGIRWSDRREDFRTEILGLMKAQEVKNAVIVPSGAKGGFVVKRPPDAGDAMRDEVVACYSTLMRGMLDITDDLHDGEIVPPDRVVRYDEDDPYLVVAADKGTATFSDIANGIAEEYGFWLGDAYASGGSTGYDHKEMGITARGAWESVRRHFRELGLDPQSEDFTAVGIGDMSGDVFGNGMLLSPHVRLVAAFDHRHIFIDPDPDAASSYEERARLYDLERSSWDHYDHELISEGGGVWPRTRKSIQLTPQIRQALDVEAERLTPNELIRAILRAPVDLLWNGGIGTYIKSSGETHADVGDKSNEPVRVDAVDLRCRVVGEGGNLGVTQRGRVEYALEGGRINTDAIDNSAGVDCSDHEVNIKILLDQAVEDGDLTTKQRNELIQEMTEEVAELVLQDNIAQNRALSNSVHNAHSMADVHRRYLNTLEELGVLDRDLEALPDDETIAERRSHGGGLTRPEFAVLLPYTKIWVQGLLLDSDLPEDDHLSEALVTYFPTDLRQRFREEMEEHRLRRELIATQVTNELVNESGTTFAFRLSEETGAAVPDIARVHAVARELFDLRGLWEDVERLTHEVPAELQTEMILEGRRLVERASRWLLRRRRRPLDIGRTIEELGPGTTAVEDAFPEVLTGQDLEYVQRTRERLVEDGVPAGLAGRVAGFRALFSSLDISDVAQATGEEVADVASVYFLLGDRLGLTWLRDHIVALRRQTRWETLARDALRDELYQQHRDLTEQVVRTSTRERDPGTRIDEWAAEQADGVERTDEVIADIRSGDAASVTTLTVALRECRNLAESSGDTRRP